MYERKWAVYNQPCPSCNSSDALQIDTHGHAFCFSCSTPFRNYWEAQEEDDRMPEKDVKIEYDVYPHRGLTRHTLDFFDIMTKFVDGEPTETAFVWPNEGIRIRRMGDKIEKKDRFTSKGNMSNPGLFGRDKFDPGSKDGVVITKSGYDAASIYQILSGRCAVVSVSSEATAKRDVIKDWDWVNSFKKIYLCMDNDDAGRKATAEIAPLFDYHRVYHIQTGIFKDANEYLQNGRIEEFQKIYESAKRFAPDNLISSFDQIRASLQRDSESNLFTYPYKTLQQMTYGGFEGEVILVKAPTGVGKTEFLRATEHSILQSTNHPIGIIHLEEDNATTVKAIAGYQLRVPATLPDCGLSEDDILEGYKKAVRDDEGRVHIYVSFDREDEELLFNTIRFLVAAAGCKIIFFDHITWMSVGKDSEDERRKLDRISQGLKLLAKELRFCLIMVSHMNAQGGSRGSANIDFTANTIIVLTRDKTSVSDIIRRTTNFTLDKVRLGGQTGPAGRALFSRETGTLDDFTEDEQLLLDYSKFEEHKEGPMEVII